MQNNTEYKVMRHIRNWVIQHLANNDAVEAPLEKSETHYSRWITCIMNESPFVRDYLQNYSKHTLDEVHESIEEGERMYEDAKKFHQSVIHLLHY